MGDGIDAGGQQSGKKPWALGRFVGGLGWYGAILATSLWVVYALSIAIPTILRCSGNWGFVSIFGWPEVKPAYSACMELNAFGDFLAGAFAPLAFLWLLITVLYQRADLVETRRAFGIQLEEARLQSQALKADLAFSQARDLREKLEKMLDLLRYDAEYATHRNVDTNSTQFFSGNGAYVAGVINDAANKLKAGGHLALDPASRRAYNGGNRMLAHLTNLKALQVGVTSDDENAALFNSCHLPDLIAALNNLNEYERAQEQQVEN